MIQVDNNITAEEYNYLTSSVGWGTKNNEYVEKAMGLSIFKKCLKDSGKPIAMAVME